MRKSRIHSEDISDQKNYLDDLQDEGELWTSLRSDALAGYGDTAPSRGKVLWGASLVLAVLILIASIWGAYRKIDRLRSEARQAAEISQMLAPVLTAQATGTTGAPESTATLPANQPVGPLGHQTATPTQTELPATQTPTPTPPNATATPTRTATATAGAVSCQDSLAYTFEIVSGPKLSPGLGYVYVMGNQPPVVQTSWVIKNTGSCSWKQLALSSNSNEHVITPILRWEGQLKSALPVAGETVLAPGEEVEVVVGYKPSNALIVHDDWVLVVNSFSLTEQPHLVVDATGWIRGIQPTNTPKKPAKTVRQTQPSGVVTRSAPTETPPPSRP